MAREIAGAFGSELFRPIATIVTPGAIAVLPVPAWLPAQYLDFFTAWGELGAAVLLVVVLTAAGLVIDAAGSHIEARLLDPALDRRTSGQHTKDWQAYLTLAFAHEPIGQRYLRTRVLQFKFELHSGLAASILGLQLLFFSSEVPGPRIMTILPFLASAYLLVEARSSHQLLSETRRVVLESVRRRGKAVESDWVVDVPRMENREEGPVAE